MNKYIALILIVVLVASACQTGRIPCPKIKTAKLRHSYVNRGFTASSAGPIKPISNAERETPSTTQNEDIHNKVSRSADVKYIKHVSVEEWDCPRPGAKKYMPRSVKENIKRNMKKLNEQADSASHSSRTPR